MSRAEALELAQRKANDWNTEYRVLRCLDNGSEQSYTVENSGSYDSPNGFRLVEVCRPKSSDALIAARSEAQR